MVWLMGAALVVCLIMVAGLLALIVGRGAATFWPVPLELYHTPGGAIMGEVADAEWYRPDETLLAGRSPGFQAAARDVMARHHGRLHRTMLRTGNFELSGAHFTWVDDAEVAGRQRPEWAVVVERIDWGRFYGTPVGYLVDGERVAAGPQESWARFRGDHGHVSERRREKEHLEKHDLGRTFRVREQARLRVRRTELTHDLPPIWSRLYAEVSRLRAAAPHEPAAGEDLAGALERLRRLEAVEGAPPQPAVDALEESLREHRRVVAATEEENQRLIASITAMAGENARFGMVLRTAGGQEHVIPVDQVVRAYPANRLSLAGKAGVYLSRWWEFLVDDPRAANSEGGVFPAIVGTVLMTLVMVILVVPFGVLAALYLREYARGGLIVSAVRIAINNLAGVPSIVFGVFGLGFFCYGVGGFIDGGPAWSMPRPGWFLLFGLGTGVAAAAFAVTLRGLARPGRLTPFRRAMRAIACVLWLASAGATLLLVATTPFFDGFYAAGLPNPTFGKAALVWASLTLALLTLPVVIVATEEAVAAVPNSLREGSYACGAGKWQTIRRIVLPRAMPGIMTGAILAMARGAGEVAPLMLVGAAKLAPELPFSWRASEQFGLNRSFMHLGFHIYDLGFQSQNSEAAKPLVFTSTLLLVLLIALLNVAAVRLRTRLRRRFAGAAF
jgi:ABC-type phosphate transport system permease subunit